MRATIIAALRLTRLGSVGPAHAAGKAEVRAFGLADQGFRVGS